METQGKTIRILLLLTGLVAVCGAVLPEAGWRLAGNHGTAAREVQPAGTVFVLSGPSGVGKSTLSRRLIQQVGDLVFAVSCTTRPPRPGEQDGVDYFFVGEAEFDRMLAQGRLAEWVEVYGHRYGLDRNWLGRQFAVGKDILMDLDTAGARTVRGAMPGAVTVLLMPPSAQELERRLRSRGTEPPGQLHLRLGLARQELARCPEYDYLVVNGAVDQAYRELEAIVLAARARRERRGEAARRILETF
jgi:guanylate kinase